MTEHPGPPQSPALKCEDCRFVRSTAHGGQCVHPEALVGVWDTGELYGSSCKALRHTDAKIGLCGPEAKLFEPREGIPPKER